MDDEQLTTGEYAMLLTLGVIVYFWVNCFAIGYFLYMEMHSYAAISLFVLSASLPAVIVACMSIVYERHSGKDANEAGALLARVYTIGYILLPLLAIAAYLYNKFK